MKPQVEGLAERVRAVLASRVPDKVVRPEARRAAVAVLITDASDPSMLLIKRKERVGDPWSGQMAFPGGFWSPADGSLEITARRETDEETGIALADAGVLLGALDDVSPRTPHLPPLVVTPYVYAVAGTPAAVPGPEADAAIWLKVRDLFDPELRRPFRLTLPGEALDYEAIVVGPYTIWGLTERVLQQLKDVSGG
jgi:8-oxo-dGTP pyrophosphatase MutT (NUDIX family)